MVTGTNSESTFVVIVRADDDMVESEILTWSGLRETWRKHEKALAHLNVISDVLEWCPSAEIQEEEWDGGAPGRSGVLHTISTRSPERLKAEMENRITELAEKIRPKRASPNARDRPMTLQEIARFLVAQAKEIDSLKAPAGYGELPKAIATRLTLAASELLQTRRTDEEVKRRLIEIADQCKVAALRSELIAIATKYGSS